MERFDNYIKSANLSPKAHQREAVEWCVKHETTKFPLLETRGGIIADEMGLGKTISTLALILATPASEREIAAAQAQALSMPDAMGGGTGTQQEASGGAGFRIQGHINKHCHTLASSSESKDTRTQHCHTLA